MTPAGPSRVPPAAHARDRAPVTSRCTARRLGGIAIGRAHLVSHATLEVAHYTIARDHVDAEVARFDNAIAESAQASSQALRRR